MPGADIERFGSIAAFLPGHCRRIKAVQAELDK